MSRRCVWSLRLNFCDLLSGVPPPRAPVPVGMSDPESSPSLSVSSLLFPSSAGTRWATGWLLSQISVHCQATLSQPGPDGNAVIQKWLWNPVRDLWLGLSTRAHYRLQVTKRSATKSYQALAVSSTKTFLFKTKQNHSPASLLPSLVYSFSHSDSQDHHDCVFTEFHLNLSDPIYLVILNPQVVLYSWLSEGVLNFIINRYVTKQK